VEDQGSVNDDGNKVPENNFGSKERKQAAQNAANKLDLDEIKMKKLFAEQLKIHKKKPRSTCIKKKI
jgi:hypothetical protein